MNDRSTKLFPNISIPRKKKKEQKPKIKKVTVGDSSSLSVSAELPKLPLVQEEMWIIARRIHAIQVLLDFLICFLCSSKLLENNA